MASQNYSIGYQVRTRVKKSITFNTTFPSETTIVGNDYVLTNDTNTFTITVSNTFTIDSVTATNCTSSWNSRTHKLTITNVSNNVVVTLRVAGPTVGLFLGNGEATPPIGYQWISGGTIYYKNKYNEDKTFVITPDMTDTWPNLILLNSTCSFEDIVISNTTSYANTKITFGQGQYQRNKYTPSSSSPTNANTCLKYGYGPISYTFTTVTGPWVVADIQDAYGPR